MTRSLISRLARRGKAIEARVVWPKVDPNRSLEDVERAYEITRETDDIPPSSLGLHPSKSFYQKTPPDFDKTRKQFDAVAARYRRRDP